MTTKPHRNWQTGLENCVDCSRCQYRKQVIPGAGNQKDPHIFFIRGPIKDYEDQSQYGSMFSTKTGSGADWLRKALKNLGLNRLEHCYTSPVVKCWAPHPPTLAEWTDCAAYLEVELQEVNPRLIVLLGEDAVKWWWENVSVMHLDQAQGIIWGSTVQKIIATHDPDELQYNEKKQGEWISDWALIAKVLKEQGRLEITGHELPMAARCPSEGQSDVVPPRKGNDPALE